MYLQRCRKLLFDQLSNKNLVLLSNVMNTVKSCINLRFSSSSPLEEYVSKNTSDQSRCVRASYAWTKNIKWVKHATLIGKSTDSVFPLWHLNNLRCIYFIRAISQWGFCTCRVEDNKIKLNNQSHADDFVSFCQTTYGFSCLLDHLCALISSLGLQT